MSETGLVLAGWLKNGEGVVSVEVSYASKYSVWVHGQEREDARTTAREAELTLELADRMVDIGRCRCVSEDGSDGQMRRFVPVERLHDFEVLFSKCRVQVVESSLTNLPLILGHKEHIDPQFRDFVSDLTYDLNVYKNLLDRLDSDCSAEPPQVREEVRGHILQTFGPELSSYLDGALARLEDVINRFSEHEHEYHGFYLRKQLWSFILTAPIMERTNLKPRGYSGDSEMMRMIYENDYAGSSTFGRILHEHAIRQSAAQAVRNRCVIVADILHRRLAEHIGELGERMRVLSVACGPAFELVNIVQTAEECDRVHFSLLDQDQQALMEAANIVQTIEAEKASRLSVDFIRESVRTMLFTKQLRERWGKFQFIYSMGLFDYLTAPVAQAVLRKLYALLTEGGEMIIGNFSPRNPSRTYMEYWLDWRIIHRSKEEFLELAACLEGADSEVCFDETGVQMLLRVKRPVEDGAD